MKSCKELNNKIKINMKVSHDHILYIGVQIGRESKSFHTRINLFKNSKRLISTTSFQDLDKKNNEGIWWNFSAFNQNLRRCEWN